MQVLQGGGLLIYPTDTLYALGGRAFDSRSAVRVRTAKGRQVGKPLPLIAADAQQAASLAAAWSDVAARLAERFWPGPLTLVLPAAQGLPEALTQGVRTIAVRVPALRLARVLCARAGPLISTSANRSGGPSPVTCAEAIVQVGPAAALALDAGPGRSEPSTLVDLAGGAPRLLRAGALPWPAIRAVCSGRDLP